MPYEKKKKKQKPEDREQAWVVTGTDGTIFYNQGKSCLDGNNTCCTSYLYQFIDLTILLKANTVIRLIIKTCNLTKMFDHFNNDFKFP